MRWEKGWKKEGMWKRQRERERGGIGWRWMLVSGDVGGPLILASSCLVIVYFFWPEIDCSRGRWICPWTFFSFSHSLFFSNSWCSAKVIMLSVSLYSSLLWFFFSPTFIYFRLQSSSIAACWKCVHMAERNGDQGSRCHCLEAAALGRTLAQLDTQGQICLCVVLLVDLCLKILSAAINMCLCSDSCL